MNISNLLNFRGLSAWAGPQGARKTATELSPLAQAVQRADQRIQTEVAANSAQLSAFGQLKSAVSDLQISAQALAQLGSAEIPESSDEVQSATTRLVSSFNTTLATARDTAALPGDVAAAQSAKSTGRALLDALSGDSATALAGLGLSVSSSGLTLDLQRLSAAQDNAPQAVLSSLGNLGRGLDNTLAQELQTQGDIGQAFSQLHQQARTLNAQQSALASAAEAASAYAVPSPRQAALSAYRASAG
jgi:hypothetical protein